MHIQDYLTSALRHWVAVVISVLVMACAALGYGVLHPPTYAATAKNYVTVDLASSVSDLNLGGSYAQQVVGSYVDVATTPIVLNKVIRQLKLDTTPQDLADQIQVSAPTASLVITVVANDSNPGRAADIANATSSSLASAVATLTPQIRSSGASVRVSQIEPATVSLKPSGPSILAQVLGGVLIGLLLGIVVAAVLELTNRRLRFASDVVGAGGPEVLGAVLVPRDNAPSSLTVQLDPWGQSAESFRQLRTTIRYSGRQADIVAISAPEDDGAKSIVAANLALAFGDTGDSTVIVDADLRHGRLSQMFGQEGAPGLTDVLAGDLALDDALLPWGGGALQVLACGSPAANRSELLQSHPMSALLGRLRERFAVVVMDTSSVLETADGVVAAHASDGVVMVARAGSTTKRSLTDAGAVLRRVHIETLGLVLADTRLSAKRGSVGSTAEMGKDQAGVETSYAS